MNTCVKILGQFYKQFDYFCAVHNECNATFAANNETRQLSDTSRDHCIHLHNPLDGDIKYVFLGVFLHNPLNGDTKCVCARARVCVKIVLLVEFKGYELSTCLRIYASAFSCVSLIQIRTNIFHTPCQ